MAQGRFIALCMLQIRGWSMWEITRYAKITVAKFVFASIKLKLICGNYSWPLKVWVSWRKLNPIANGDNYSSYLSREFEILWNYPIVTLIASS